MAPGETASGHRGRTVPAARRRAAGSPDPSDRARSLWGPPSFARPAPGSGPPPTSGSVASTGLVTAARRMSTGCIDPHPSRREAEERGVDGERQPGQHQHAAPTPAARLPWRRCRIPPARCSHRASWVRLPHSSLPVTMRSGTSIGSTWPAADPRVPPRPVTVPPHRPRTLTTGPRNWAGIGSLRLRVRRSRRLRPGRPRVRDGHAASGRHHWPRAGWHRSWWPTRRPHTSPGACGSPPPKMTSGAVADEGTR